MQWHTASLFPLELAILIALKNTFSLSRVTSVIGHGDPQPSLAIFYYDLPSSVRKYYQSLDFALVSVSFIALPLLPSCLVCPVRYLPFALH